MEKNVPVPRVNYFRGSVKSNPFINMLEGFFRMRRKTMICINLIPLSLKTGA